jgi:hypothetical protein
VEPEERHSFGEEALRCIHTAEVAVSVVMSAQVLDRLQFSRKAPVGNPHTAAAEESAGHIHRCRAVVREAGSRRTVEEVLFSSAELMRVHVEEDSRSTVVLLWWISARRRAKVLLWRRCAVVLAAVILLSWIVRHGCGCKGLSAVAQRADASVRKAKTRTRTYSQALKGRSFTEVRVCLWRRASGRLMAEV